MSTQTAPGTFSRSARAHLCSHCGAATPVPIEGGACACVRCGTTLSITPRPDELPRHPVPVTEADRRARLAAQQDTPMIPPPAIMPLFAGGGLSPLRRSEAEASWQALRRAVAAAPHDLSAADALSMLTIALVGLPDEDPARARARLESAREILTMPRHRDGLACSMARIAARAGAIDDAESWLALVDPESDVLEIDSGARFARALIAITRAALRGEAPAARSLRAARDAPARRDAPGEGRPERPPAARDGVIDHSGNWKTISPSRTMPSSSRAIRSIARSSARSARTSCWSCRTSSRIRSFVRSTSASSSRSAR